MKSEKGLIAIYSRKSKFTGKGESIGNQVELCKEYIRTHYGEKMLEKIVVYEDEGFSGGNLNRPDFKKMMEATKQHTIQAIVVYRLDRISRNISDFTGLIEELARLQVDFISIKEQFDTSTPMGRAMMYIASVFSQLERETIAERIRDNMRELAKTGRWLGGTRPTGYTSEAAKSITVDGKTKKIYSLKLLEEEAKIVRLIFDLYMEYDSQTLTEAELLKRGIKTKKGNAYTRFAIKAILQNPVYMVADEDAYEYFESKEVEIFAKKEDFDNVRGVMAYNRTDQEKGRTTIYRPISEWIVAVGEHKGIIPGKVWVAVQDSLERNKVKSFRKPRRNEALLTGFIFCSCGNRMYPKLSNRKTADGELIYSYVCKMKERSQRSVCNSKNANGNTLDVAIVEEIKNMGEIQGVFMQQLEQSRNFYSSNRGKYEERLKELHIEKAEAEKKMEGLVDSLVEVQEGIAKKEVGKRIEKLKQECLEIDAMILELETLTSQYTLSDVEFDMLRHLLCIFKERVDEMGLEQKRTALRSVVRKIIWDGQNAHVYLCGIQDETIEFPEISLSDDLIENNYDESEELEKFDDVDYEEDTLEVFLEEKNNFVVHKTPGGEDSK